MSVFNKLRRKQAKSSAKVEAAPQPRLMPKIQEEHTQLIQRAGVSEYQIFIHTEELRQVNEALRRINYEAANRQRMDAEAQASQAQKEATNDPA